MSSRQPGHGRYVALEREQRWLLQRLPMQRSDPAAIHDRYIDGTRLRLRRVDHHGEIVLKLGQKVRLGDEAAECVRMTNIYLDEAEYQVFTALPAAELFKRRWRVMEGERVFAVDEFTGRLAGLMLAELELSADEPRTSPPSFASLEVTDDERFTGGSLARLNRSEALQLLRSTGPASS